jgi:hypothetical protein
METLERPKRKWRPAMFTAIGEHWATFKPG